MIKVEFGVSLLYKSSGQYPTLASIISSRTDFATVPEGTVLFMVKALIFIAIAPLL